MTDRADPTGVDAGRRRLLLVLAGAPFLVGAVAACSASPALRSVPGPRPDVDVKVRWRAAHGERTLLAMYTAVIADHPGLAERLGPMRRRHEEHLTALEADGPLPFAGRELVPTPGRPTPPAAADQTAALTAIRDAEADQSEARIADCVSATGPRLAVMLASIAACEAAHHTALGDA